MTACKTNCKTTGMYTDCSAHDIVGTYLKTIYVGAANLMLQAYPSLGHAGPIRSSLVRRGQSCWITTARAQNSCIYNE